MATYDYAVIGGGIVGCSIAYHLTREGITNVVLLERRQLTSGTTWHAAGLVGQLRATRNLTELAKYTATLFEGLEKETGQATGFKQNGSVSIALAAPCANAWSRFSGVDAQAITSAPSSRPTCTAARPTPPAAPITSSRSPGASIARSRRPCSAVR